MFVNAATGMRAIGVEIDPCRHAIATRRQRSVQQLLPGGEPLSYVLGDVQTAGMLRGLNATHLFMHSTCFGTDLLLSIANVARAAGVRCILDLGIDDVRTQLTQGFGKPIAVARAPTTWASAGMPMFYYASRALPGVHKLAPVDNRTRATWRARTRQAIASQQRESDATIG